METSNVQRPTFNVQRGAEASAVAWRLIAVAVGGLFIYAGALKAWDPVRFASDIENFKILPWTIGVRLAFYLPWLEILCGIALITRRWYSGALFLVMLLMVVFIAATIAAKARGIDISCGCFGHVLDQMKFAWHLALDLAILGAVVALWFSRDRLIAVSHAP